MGLWPGDDYFSRRYDYLTEYVQVLRDLWGTGKSDFKGDFFTMNDCRVSPQPSVPMKVICAGQSDAGMEFSAKYADFNFCFGKGVNTPAAFAPTAARMKEATDKTGRDVGSYVLFMVIADETDEAARAKWQRYKDGADEGGPELADRAKPEGYPLRHGHQRSPDGRPDVCRQYQHGHPGWLVCQRRQNARRSGCRARRRRRAADLR